MYSSYAQGYQVVPNLKTSVNIKSWSHIVKFECTKKQQQKTSFEIDLTEMPFEKKATALDEALY